jgi:hypothetical protein
MKIAKIVSSNSHIDYIGRVIDTLDAAEPPSAEDYGFAQFVKLSFGESEMIGVIYNSLLVNPEYASYGPRLSPAPALGNFSPDYLNEQGILIGILLLGTAEKSAEKAARSHGIPRGIVPAGADVFKLGADEVKKFHTGENGALRVSYYSQIVAHAGLFAVPLLEAIIGQLILDCPDAERRRLNVLKQTLAWQRTLGGMRL